MLPMQKDGAYGRPVPAEQMIPRAGLAAFITSIDRGEFSQTEVLRTGAEREIGMGDGRG